MQAFNETLQHACDKTKQAILLALFGDDSDAHSSKVFCFQKFIFLSFVLFFYAIDAIKVEIDDSIFKFGWAKASVSFKDKKLIDIDYLLQTKTERTILVIFSLYLFVYV